MPNETLISEIENMLAEIVRLGGENERSQIVPNLTVQNANPGISGFVIVSDDRDGNNILAKTVPGVIYANNDLVNVMFLRGGEAIAFQQGSQSANAGMWEIVPSTSTDIFYDKGDVGIGKSVAPDAALESLHASQAQLRLTHTEDIDFVDITVDANGDVDISPSGTGIGINKTPTQPLDVTGKILSDDAINADNFAFIVKNTSGATANANDVGYINEDGEYKTTTTAQAELTWCIVIIGGANNADIHVSRRGRVTVAYTGSAPSTGDYLVTSTSAGDALGQATMRPEIFAICLANGAGGTVSALLLCQRKSYPIASNASILFVNVADASDFVSTIAAAGISGDKIYYNAPTSGGVAAINPFATNDLAKITIHNTTQVEEAYVIDTGTDGTGNFIQVSVAADISGWVATDAITARSQTNTSTISSAYFFDLLFTSSEVPELTTKLSVTASYRDTGAADKKMVTHTYQANSNNKRQNTVGFSTALNNDMTQIIPVLSNRFCVLWEASGSGTAIPLLRIREITVAAP